MKEMEHLSDKRRLRQPELLKLEKSWGDDGLSNVYKKLMKGIKESDSSHFSSLTGWEAMGTN